MIFQIIYMAVTSRMSGGGLGAHLLPKWLTWLPEVLFALPFGVIWFNLAWPDVLIALLAFAWSYIWMQSATGPALQWGDDPTDGMARTRTLSPVVNWISDRLGFQHGDINYCRTWMAVKGFLIGLPVGGILLAVLWPLAYEGGYRLRGKVSFDPHAFSELAAGAGAGISILAFLALKHLIQ